MTRGGKREGAGRPKKPESEQAKRYTFRLYQWEVEKVREFIKSLRTKIKVTKSDRDEVIELCMLQAEINYHYEKRKRENQRKKEEYDKMLSELKNQTSQNEQEGP